MYAATSNGFFRSVDGGRTWRATLRNVFVEDIAFAGGPSRLFATTFDDLYVSDDRGQIWTRTRTLEAWNLAVGDDGQVLYAAKNEGVIRSTDSGVTFAAPGAGLPADVAIFAIAIDPHDPDAAYAADAWWNLVFKTTDGGAHWTPARTGLDGEIWALLVDPANGETLYAATYPWLFKSTNGGTSWSKLTASEAAYRALAIAPGVVAAGSHLGVHLSHDGGATWSEPRPPSTHSVAIDPKSPANAVASADTKFELRAARAVRGCPPEGRDLATRNSATAGDRAQTAVVEARVRGELRAAHLDGVEQVLHMLIRADAPSVCVTL
ncbi:MAG: WD40/YVTN/BNR-like repeat-containing protein [Thermoanaerobaculia bacterium]